MTIENSFGKAANDMRSVTVSIDAMRGQAIKRLTEIQQKLESKGISSAFTRNAKPDAIGDAGILNGVIIGAILGGPIADLFEGSAISDVFNCVSAQGVMEGVSMLCDERAEAYRTCKLADYPEGRRKCSLWALHKTKERFNLVSANQNSRLSWDVQAEIACMFEIIDMLDRLQHEGVQSLRVNPDAGVYDVLKENAKKMFTNKPVRTYAAPAARRIA